MIVFQSPIRALPPCPPGHLIIAQPFMAGLMVANQPKVPKGRQKSSLAVLAVGALPSDLSILSKALFRVTRGLWLCGKNPPGPAPDGKGRLDGQGRSSWVKASQAQSSRFQEKKIVYFPGDGPPPPSVVGHSSRQKDIGKMYLNIGKSR